MPIRAFRSIAGAFVAIASLGMPTLAADLEVPAQFATIQSAILAAADGDRVVVAPGTYTETIDFLGKVIAVVSSGGAATTVIDAGGSGSVVTFQLTGSGATLRGFTLTGGTGTTIGGNLIGGGILLKGASADIESNIIRACTAWNGGAIACLGGASPKIIGNLLESNDAYNLGGAIHCDEGSRADILDNDLHDNGAPSGPAIAIVGGASPLIQGNTFRHNRLGAIYALNGQSAIILGNEFRDHTGHAIGLVESNGFVIEDNRIAGLYEQSGVNARSCNDLTIARNRLDEQTVALNSCSDVDYEANHMVGSQMLLNFSERVRLVSSVFTDSVQSAGQHAVYTLHTDVDIVHCTLLHEGLPHGAISLLEGSNVTLLNTIVWGDAPPLLARPGTSLTARGCNINGGFPGEGNIDADPRIVFGAAEFHLGFGSPCIDAGVPGEEVGNADIDGDPREVGAGGDIGADEFVAHIAARFGNVRRHAEPVLTVNGSAGDHRRIVRISRTEPLRVDLGVSSAGPATARFAIYAWRAEPDASTIRLQPHGLGWMSFPTPLQMEPTNQPVAIWNTLGRPGRLGHATRSSTIAPTTLLEVQRGTRVPVTFTLQGFIEDLGSQAQGPVSITNAIVVIAE